MLEDFVYTLNNQTYSNLVGNDVSVKAFSGSSIYRNNPNKTREYGGPIPPGIYFIVDRPGGTVRRLKELLTGRYDRWSRFALYQFDDSIDDTTDACNKNKKNCNTRGNFRLHPGGLSAGCLTVGSRDDYNKIRESLLTTKQSLIPGTEIMYYGTVTVIVPVNPHRSDRLH